MVYARKNGVFPRKNWGEKFSKIEEKKRYLSRPVMRFVAGKVISATIEARQKSELGKLSLQDRFDLVAQEIKLAHKRYNLALFQPLPLVEGGKPSRRRSPLRWFVGNKGLSSFPYLKEVADLYGVSGEFLVEALFFFCSESVAATDFPDLFPKFLDELLKGFIAHQRIEEFIYGEGYAKEVVTAEKAKWEEEAESLFPKGITVQVVQSLLIEELNAREIVYFINAEGFFGKLGDRLGSVDFIIVVEGAIGVIQLGEKINEGVVKQYRLLREAGVSVEQYSLDMPPAQILDSILAIMNRGQN